MQSITHNAEKCFGCLFTTKCLMSRKYTNRKKKNYTDLNTNSIYLNCFISNTFEIKNNQLSTGIEVNICIRI